MIQVSILNTITNQAYGGQFPDQTTANAWIAEGTAANWWGLPARTLVANSQGVVVDIDGSSPNLSLATSQGTQTNPDGSTPVTYAMPAQYTVTSTDISAQVAQQQAIQQGLQDQQTGATIIAAIYALNNAKMQAGTLTVAQFQAMMQDPTISLIRECLWTGALSAAKAMITAYDVTAVGAYFSAADKTAILGMLSSVQ